jgi:hypothetical protein
VLVEAKVVAAVCGLLAAACGTRGRDEVPGDAVRTPGTVALEGCNVEEYTSVRFLAALPAVVESSGRKDLAEDLATRAQGLLLHMSAGPRIVSTLSWGGPDRGALLLMTCEGRVLASAELGYVWKLRARDVTGQGLPDVIVEQQTGTGTGWSQRQTTVYSFAGDTITVLWSAVTFEAPTRVQNLAGLGRSEARCVFLLPGESKWRETAYQSNTTPRRGHGSRRARATRAASASCSTVSSAYSFLSGPRETTCWSRSWSATGEAIEIESAGQAEGIFLGKRPIQE